MGALNKSQMLSKKNMILFSLALLLVGCANENLISIDGERGNQKETPLSFTAQHAGLGTKAAIGDSATDEGGVKTTAINWQSDDKISVFDGAAQNCQFSAKGLTAESSACTFEGKVYLPSNNYTAVYPYISSAKVNDGRIGGITLPASQRAIAGSFDPCAALMAAKTVDGGRELPFRNLVGYVKLTTDFASKTIKLCSGGGEPLAGEGSISFDAEGVPSFTLSGGMTSEITLAAEGEGTLAAGTYYIAAAEGTLAGGWSINITDADGVLRICESGKPLTIKKSGVINLGTMSKSAMDDINSLVYDIRTDQLEYRDPFIYVDKEAQAYYFPAVVAGGIEMYKSRDLNMWRSLGKVYNVSGIYSDYVLWAADMYKWKDEMYCIATAVPTTYADSFSAKKCNTIFKANGPEGVMSPLNPDHLNIIPETDTQNIDGVLYVDENSDPWIVYCKEAATNITSNGYDAGIFAYKLSDDLKTTVGAPVNLFNSSSSQYSVPVDVRDGKNVYIADAPILWRDPATGNLICIWSHYAKKSASDTQKWYSIGQAVSTSGKIEGPWEHKGIINDYDGGHGCIFEDLNGNLKMAYHLNPTLAANGKPHLVIRDIAIQNGILVNSSSVLETADMDQTQFKVLFCNSSRAYEHKDNAQGALHYADTYKANFLIDGVENKGWYSNFQWWEPFVQDRSGVEKGTDDYDYSFTEFHAFKGRRCAVSIVIDMQKSVDVAAVGLLNRRPNNAEVTDTKSVEFYVSDDPEFIFTPAKGVSGYDYSEYGNPSQNSWTRIAANDNLAQSQSTQWLNMSQEQLLTHASRGRFLKIRLLGTFDASAITLFSLSEIYVKECTSIR